MRITSSFRLTAVGLGSLRKESSRRSRPQANRTPSCPKFSFPVGGTWSDDGNIYIGDYFGDRLVTIHEDGGPTSTIHGEWRDKNFQWIEALPDGKGLLSSKRGAGLTHVESSSGKQRVLLPLDNDIHPLYSAGRLFYAFDGRLMARSFDLNSLTQ